MQPINLTLNPVIENSCQNWNCCFPGRQRKRKEAEKKAEQIKNQVLSPDLQNVPREI